MMEYIGKFGNFSFFGKRWCGFFLAAVFHHFPLNKCEWLCVCIYVCFLALREWGCVCVYCVFIDETLPPPPHTQAKRCISFHCFSEGIYLRSQHSSVCRSLCFVGADFSGGRPKTERVAEPKGRHLKKRLRGRLWNEKDLIMSLCDGRQWTNSRAAAVDVFVFC